VQWHPLFAHLLRPLLEDYYEVQTDVSVGDLPRQADLDDAYVKDGAVKFNITATSNDGNYALDVDTISRLSNNGRSGTFRRNDDPREQTPTKEHADGDTFPAAVSPSHDGCKLICLCPDGRPRSPTTNPPATAVSAGFLMESPNYTLSAQLHAQR
jgi:hypothetical protein